MRFSEWIKSRLDALNAMVSLNDDTDEGDVVIDEGPPLKPLIMKFSSNPAHVSFVRKSVERFCEKAGLDSVARDEVGLVVNEALANVIRHAYGGATDQVIEVVAHQIENGVSVSIHDWGNGVDPSTKAPVEKDPLMPGGLGLMCMSRLMDSVKYEPQPDGMLLTMTRTTGGSKCALDDEIDG